MQTQLAKYIDALGIIHIYDNFWVLDHKLQLIYNNNCSCPLESLQIINLKKAVDLLSSASERR
ncbi:MAG: hypothetical protein ACK5Z5_02840 [Neisseriaceae bacterium]|jgi:hypothetical protein